MSVTVTAMDKVKGVAKGGWHPKGKDGGKESWRGEFKGINQVVCPNGSRSTYLDLGRAPV